jgi:hypothetical protein
VMGGRGEHLGVKKTGERVAHLNLK